MGGTVAAVGLVSKYLNHIFIVNFIIIETKKKQRCEELEKEFQFMDLGRSIGE